MVDRLANPVTAAEAPAGAPVDLIIRGGTVVDGTGGPRRTADVAVAADRIAAVTTPGELPATDGVREIDASGKIVCPGFIDIHTHSDVSLLSAPDAPSAVRQGTTTQVVGNCGLGVFPTPDGDDEPTRLRQAVAYLDVDPTLQWRSYSRADDYFDALTEPGIAINVGSLVGQLPLHTSVVGYGDAVPDAEQLGRMCELLDEALEQGALGLSTGLVYAPLTMVGREELHALAAVVKRHDGLFAWHARDYGDHLLDAVDEVLDVARATGVRTQISHLVTVGARNFGKVEPVWRKIEQANAEGCDISADLYPYLAGNCPLSQLLPTWVFAEGIDRAHAHLTDPRSRRRIDTEFYAAMPNTWDEVVVSRLPAAATAEYREQLGRSIGEVATSTGRQAADVALDLLAEFGHEVITTISGRSADDLALVLGHPRGLIASDGQSLDPDGPSGQGVPHPRSYGCFVRLLTDYSELRQPGPGLAEPLLTLEGAVAKCTAAPAERIGLTDRGRLLPGLCADVVVLDPERLRDSATYAAPHSHPEGVDAVLVNGRQVVGDGAEPDARPGRLLRG